jgi:hypothetical protein
MTYRYKNGHVDNGTPISGARKTCPNCRSSNYIETLSMEKCNSCGLQCDYWGGGINDVYNSYMDNQYAEERRKEHEERIAWESDESNWRY